ncbi:hypothetical protein ACIQ9Q_39105 [Streptomyces sp. NPDC094438]|uniref:hypothetical protein n=1 Tax=Streptomyces sp. NPDC094438 TaxID=3366061 RepID=UPI0037F89956
MIAGGKPDRRALTAVAVVHVTAAALTWRDLRCRTAGQVRGDKGVWRMASVLNTLGSATYWLFGRRQDAGPLTHTQKRAIGPQ